jgi:hypothetical protein
MYDTLEQWAILESWSHVDTLFQQEVDSEEGLKKSS